MAKYIGQAIEYLHDNGIILRNLQADSIMMSEDADHATPKILRLDKAQIINTDEHAHGQFGDVRFKPPEVLRNQCYKFNNDSWSYGVIIYFMITGVFPYDSDKIVHFD